MKMTSFLTIVSLLVLLCFLWCLVVMPPPAEPQTLPEQTRFKDALIDLGEKTFDDIKNSCGMCHKIKEDDNRRAPLLKSLSERMSFEKLKGWLSKHLHEPPRRFMFVGETGPSIIELLALTNYLWTI